MSRWNHAICDACWKARCEARGEAGRVPVRVLSEPGGPPTSGACCWCRAATAGIYVRSDPKTTPCHGDGHSED